MSEIVILGLTLKGGGVYTEQYTAYRGDRPIGCLRLRNGCFTAAYQHTQDNSDPQIEVYSSCTVGDSRFDEDEREMELTKAVIELINAESIANYVERRAGA